MATAPKKSTARSKPATKRTTKKTTASPKSRTPSKTKVKTPIGYRFSASIADEIIERMALGETIVQITASDDMPNQVDIYRRRKNDQEFESRFTRAREDQMHTWSDQIVGLIDSACTGYKQKVQLDSEDLKKIEEDGYITFVFDRTHLEHAKARVDVRKFLMAKIVPQVFGERHQVDLNMSWEEKDDNELLLLLKDAAEKSEMDLEAIISIFATAMELK